MVFQNIHNIDARYAIINNVGRDQYNVYKFESQLCICSAEGTYSNLNHIQQEIEMTF
jgi:hypothetical protein